MKTPEDRTTAIGIFADCARYMGPAIQPFFNALLPLVAQGLADTSSDVQRNAVYCAGLLAQHCSALVLPHVRSLLGAISPFLTQVLFLHVCCD